MLKLISLEIYLRAIGNEIMSSFNKFFLVIVFVFLLGCSSDGHEDQIVDTTLPDEANTDIPDLAIPKEDISITRNESKIPRAVSKSCDENSLSIDLGFTPVTGTVEILTPISDTHAKHPYRVKAQPIICIDNRVIAEWIERAYSISAGTTFEVTYDPLGTASQMRSQYDYSVLMCDELDAVEAPPSDIRIGRFAWPTTIKANSLKVFWVTDFRGDLEDECF